MKRKRLGFTMIEMIIALAFTVIILGIASSMLITGNKVFSDSDIKSTLQIEGQTIQEKISDMGMQASGTINDPTLGTLIKSYNKSGQERYYQIEQAGKQLSIIEYSKNGSDFYNENSQSISDHVAAFNVTYGSNFAEFSISLSLQKGYSDVNYQVQFKIAFRNKNN
ncbi:MULTISPECIES: prepilin-type N-terminal cleavage/methylation domain-containing protein [unclassified Clostridium]|uniref:PilW family protein n=1 Tax=unclassified Clostridium TaxID=2614128 RepID=UPI000297D199|nr:MULTISPECIES: prepilin-type N-terminal cleavage/methylation domain-containing protein [unclassified Clostridium]EKQ51187.1 MAG: hypothetical protein A370_05056 [Clostridium sp. Maddingley MBC34-26]